MLPADLLPQKFFSKIFKLRLALLGAGRIRRTRFYCVGAPKTGTHSIALMFDKCAHSKHEPDWTEMMRRYFEFAEGRVTEAEFVAWLRRRDEEFSIEVDASNFYYHLIDQFLREFPDARFLLTIRDCYSWLESYLNHQLRYASAGEDWDKLNRLRFHHPEWPHSSGEKILKEHGLFTVDGYLSYWRRHNEDILAKVPAERLLVVRTGQIATRAGEIADFAGLPRHAVRLKRAHEFKNPAKHGLIHQIDRAFLEQKVEQYCRPLMRRFFPEIKSLDDAKL